MDVKKDWLTKLFDLKISILRIAIGNDTSQEAVNEFDESIGRFQDFVETYKGVIRKYPSTEEVINAYNKIAEYKHTATDNFSNFKDTLENFLNVLDGAIEKLNAKISERSNVTNQTIVVNDGNVQIGDNNSQYINDDTKRVEEKIKELIELAQSSNISENDRRNLLLNIRDLLNSPAIASVLGGLASGLASLLS